MTSPSTPPGRAWPDRASVALAAALVLIGAGTLAGWWMRSDELLQPFPGTAALKINEAAGIWILGLVFLAIEFGRRNLAFLAVIPALIALITLAEEVLQSDLRIDEFFGRDHLLVGAAHPGRMSATAAACLLLGGLALLWRAIDRAGRPRLFAEAVSGSLLVSAGFSTLLGYAAGLPTVYSWGTATATAPVGAIAAFLLGGALILLAWRDRTATDGEPPAWTPMPAVMLCLTLTAILWIGLRERERTYLGSKSKNAINLVATEFGRVLDSQTNHLERMARRWGDGPDRAFSGWDTDAKAYLADARELGTDTLAFVNPAGRTVWIYPAEGNESAANFNHASIDERRAAFENARTSGGPVVSATTIVRGRKGLEPGAVIYAPVVRAGLFTGCVATEFDYSRVFRNITALRLKLDSHYHISISVAQDIVYFSAAADPSRHEDLIVERAFTVAGRPLRVSIVPSDTALAEDRRYLPELALVAGFGITILLGLSGHLWRRARAGQNAAELSNKKLLAENEERRRIEARLKVSDERLRLALDSTQIGIYEWSVAAGHVYYSPGLWAMLGYEHSRMPSTVEAWQSLIHPDDLPLYRRRTDSQLGGIATFIEPEYRVRARSGDWRWVYTRSKSVATGADGRPTRIIGTVQDITARREAEFALRESQAEARKLSLVASKTDNPVLIGSPDGRIEWANEAFCRVMEYRLDEVVGKNPAHFLVGAETDRRSLLRIRTAMRAGQGISTDLVTYSKSGRKYHVHVELQPVRGAGGQVENFIAVETDITARVHTEQELRRAKAEADDASRAKSEFLASMSHEIRTPMNGVIGMTSLLMETTLSAEQRDFVSTIRTSGDALLTIINDILDFSKIESGKLELEYMPFDLPLCLEEALDLFALQASAKKLELTYHIAPDVPAWIVGDVTRLRQVVVNLVNNAVKFTPSGSISVEVRRVTREIPLPGFTSAFAPDSSRLMLEFTVRDSGIGIPPERLDRLFKAFSQVDSSTTRKYGGTGLGLAISQRLCRLMGGAVRAESGADQGSAFIFTIQTAAAEVSSDSGLPPLPAVLRAGTVLCVEDHPVTQARLRTLFEKWGVKRVLIAADATAALALAAQLPAPPALLIVDHSGGESAPPFASLDAIACPRLLLYPFGQTVPVALFSSPPFATSSKPIRTSYLTHAVVALFHQHATDADPAAKKIERPIGEEIPLVVLLAEDNAVNQKVALRFLERLGYRADAVANGLEAVTALENRHYDLVLMDVQMPEMDGYEATRQIRARLPAHRQPKIFALTANAMQGDRDLCVAAGMDDHISKPVKMHEISAAIRRHFGKPAANRTPRVSPPTESP